MLFLCRFLTFFIYIFLLQILARCNLYLCPLLSISSVGSWLGRTAPCSRTRTRSRSTTVTANPPRFGHTTFPHLSTYLLLAWFDSTDFLFICLFFTPYILRKRRSENDYLSRYNKFEKVDSECEKESFTWSMFSIYVWSISGDNLLCGEGGPCL